MLFTAFGQEVSWLEATASVAGLTSVLLAQRMKVLNWPAGIVSVCCFAVVFYEAKLYADAALQLVFLALDVFGWWRWSRTRQDDGVTRMKVREIAAICVVVPALTLVAATWLLHRTDSPAPWADAAILATSLAALFAQARRRIECWALWVLVDLVAVPLYWRRDLPVTTALYVVFLLLGITGFMQWERRLRRRRASGS